MEETIIQTLNAIKADTNDLGHIDLKLSDVNDNLQKLAKSFQGLTEKMDEEIIPKLYNTDYLENIDSKLEDTNSKLDALTDLLVELLRKLDTMVG